jgi:uncharacterized LabA/DUF88 family protein
MNNSNDNIQVKMSQTVAVLIDGNNIEISVKDKYKNKIMLVDYDNLIPKLIGRRTLNRLKYFREGRSISPKLAKRLHDNFYGVVIPCHKTADIPLTIEATQLADKVDTIIIFSGDSDYVELVSHLKSRGVRVEIVSMEKSTAKILLDEADYNYFLIDEDFYELKPQTKFVRPSDNSLRFLPTSTSEAMTFSVSPLENELIDKTSVMGKTNTKKYKQTKVKNDTEPWNAKPNIDRDNTIKNEK